MGASGIAALAFGWLIARRVAGRLSRPVSDLAAAAARIGDGEAVDPSRPSGIGEIDTLAIALAGSSTRVNEALARERRFSADVSHQLRTPLTGLRLGLEAVSASSDVGAAIGSALADLDRLEHTVGHLLPCARGSVSPTATTELDVIARHAVGRWTPAISSADRTIQLTESRSITATVRPHPSPKSWMRSSTTRCTTATEKSVWPCDDSQAEQPSM